MAQPIMIAHLNEKHIKTTNNDDNKKHEKSNNKKAWSY